MLFIRPGRSFAPAAAASLVALGVDLLTHYSVFIHPTSSTAALGLFFARLWSAFFLVPVTATVVKRLRPVRPAQSVGTL